MSSDDEFEPNWLVEQSSAQKERMAVARRDSSDDFSLSDNDAPSEAEDAAGGGKAVKGGKGGEKSDKGKEKKGRAPPSARLPLLLAPKVRRDLLLLEANDPGLDLSGDFGCIGKLHVRKAGAGAGSSSKPEDGDAGRVAELRQTLMLDLKGKVYDADILPCNSLCLLAVDGAKAKVEAVFSDFVQLAPPRDSIFDMQEVAGGQFDADFFDDGEVLSNAGGDSADEDEALGPLREHRDGGKKKGGGKGKSKAKKPAGKKPAAGAKRKSTGGGGGGKKAKS